MLTSISMKNFKVFEDETLELGRLNLLTGLNSSGKSSVIQALRLVNPIKTSDKIGPLKEYIRNDNVEFNIKCTLENGDQELRFCYNRKSGIIGNDDGLISDVFSYISADRWGPRSTLPLYPDGDVPPTVGRRGEYIVDFLSSSEELRVPNALTHDGGVGMKHNIEGWLREISPGVELSYERYLHKDIGMTMFNGRCPVHVGFGLSYALPVIASVLVHSAQIQPNESENINSAFLLVENPEAHLHPSGQTMMGRLFALAASCGLQIVVETHSDHVLNGIRLAVKEGKLSCNDVKIYFFKTTDEPNHDPAPAIVEQLVVDKYGMLDHWPDGFFDETEKTLMCLI
jgi:predicted ATPase